MHYLISNERGNTMKRIISCIILSAMICSCFASCGDKSNKKNNSPTAQGEVNINVPAEKDPNATEPPSAKSTEGVEFEDSVAARSGDAYLAIVDGKWQTQYWGKNDDPETAMLSYDAGVVPITGNGDYTVSVTADTKGFRYITTGDPEGECTPEGLSFMSVMISDGEKLFPESVITVNSVKVDGKEIDMKAKAYTSSDDGKETRANLYNEYVSVPPKKARTADGALYDANEKALPVCGDYSAQVVDTADFDKWTTVEVNFTVSGIE